jgi:formamidopyrimidine-DNA glycosylase
VPELPEVETARSLIADRALHRRIAGVDDADTFVCRPHSPGELPDALTGRMLTAAHRRGKTMWCETSGVGRSTQPDPAGPELGIHLGMGGRIVVTSPAGEAVEGGGPARRAGHARAVPRPDHQGVHRGQGPPARSGQDRRRREPAGR